MLMVEAIHEAFFLHVVILARALMRELFLVGLQIRTRYEG